MALEVGLMNIVVGLGLADDAGAKLAQQIGAAAGPAAENAGKTISEKISGGLNKAGKTLSTGLTAPVLAIGGAAVAAGMQIDGALDTIRIKTGATGSELDQLGKDFEAVAKTSTGSFERTGEVIADLNTRLGLTGQPLQDLAKQILDLEQITGTTANLDTLTRTFAAFGVPAEEANVALDKLFRASQATGVPFDQLTGKLVSQSAAFAELGFGMDETAALLGQFEKAGVNTDTVLGALRVNIVKAAKEGKDAATFFRDGVKEIEGYIASGDNAAAQAKASELFGARTFLDALDAIKRGQFDIEGTVNAIQNGGDSISGLADATADFPEKLEKLKKSFGLALLPLAETLIPAITDAVDALLPFIESIASAFRGLSPEVRKTIVIVAGLAAAIGPVLLIGAKVVTAIGTIGKAIKGLTLLLSANPWVLVAAAAVAAIVLIVKNWDKIAPYFEAIWGAIKTAAEAVWNFISGAATFVADAVRTAWNGIADFFQTIWDLIVAGVKIALSVTGIGLLITIVQTIRDNWSGIVAFFEGIWNAIVTGVKTAVSYSGIGLLIRTVQAIKDNWGGIVSFFQGIWGKISGGVRAVTDTIRNLFKGAFDTIKNGINGVRDFIRGVFDQIGRIFSDAARKLRDFVNKIPGAGIVKKGLSFIPGLAEGGPMQAGKPYIVGERGPELVVPRTSGTVIPNNALASLGGGINYEINIVNPTPEPASTSIPDALRRAAYLRQR